MTERERGQGTVRWVTALSDTRAALDESDTERPFSQSGSPVLPLLPPGEGKSAGFTDIGLTFPALLPVFELFDMVSWS